MQNSPARRGSTLFAMRPMLAMWKMRRQLAGLQDDAQPHGAQQVVCELQREH